MRDAAAAKSDHAALQLEMNSLLQHYRDMAAAAVAAKRQVEARYKGQSGKLAAATERCMQLSDAAVVRERRLMELLTSKEARSPPFLRQRIASRCNVRTLCHVSRARCSFPFCAVYAAPS